MPGFAHFVATRAYSETRTPFVLRGARAMFGRRTVAARTPLTSMIVMSLAAAPALGQATLTPLGDLPGGGFSSRASGVSPDGSTVVGGSQSALSNPLDEAFRWTGGGMIGLGDLPGGGDYSSASGVSGNGSTVVGTSGGPNGTNLAFRWTAAGGMVSLGDLPGGANRSSAHAVSDNGLVIVGSSSSTASGNVADEAFRWTLAGGLVPMGDFNGGAVSSAAHGVNSDGSVIVGQASGLGGQIAFRWTAGGGMVSLGDLFGGETYSEAYDISADGSTVVGMSRSSIGDVAFVWTAATGIVALAQVGSNPNAEVSRALGASGNGSVIVGVGGDPVGPGFGACVWTSAGVQLLWDKLVAAGVDPAADGWSDLTSATGVSDDGNTIVGSGTRNGNTEGFIANLASQSVPGDANGDGSVDVDDLIAVILGWGPCPKPPADCPSDVNDSGTVDVDDLIMVILNWG
jgi:probable HAF family extracellular repeat protein